MDIFKAVGYLCGTNLTPLHPEKFSGVVAVPKKYFTEGRTDQDALLAFLEDDDWESNFIK